MSAAARDQGVPASNFVGSLIDILDRVYPGDGVAPLKQIIADLRAMEGTKILSLELFNREYWQQDPLQVARMGLEKMKAACEV